MPSNSVLGRYRDLVADFALFEEVCKTPLPLSCWVSHTRPFGRDLLLTSGARESQVSRHSFRDLSTDFPFATAFLSGSILLQEEVAQIPALLLDPKPGEIILDLCAAPGNKTAQISNALGETGCVIANDISTSRLNVLRGTLDRMGLCNVLVTNHDARAFPDHGQRFDAVLADVPCSCEGTSRRHPAVLRTQPAETRNKLIRIQEAILRRAIRLTRTGGRVLYATCTYAPEENEGVLNAMLLRPESGQEVELQTISLEGFEMVPGLDSFGGKSFHTSMKRSARVWPEKNDTGGFFVGLLRKVGPQSEGELIARVEASPGVAIRTDSDPWRAYGIDQTAVRLLRRLETGGKYDRLLSHGVTIPHGVTVCAVGMMGLNQKSDTPRFSTPLAIKTGAHAKAAVAEIDSADIGPYYRREAVSPIAVSAPNAPTRTVIVRSGRITLGLGRIENRSSGSGNIVLLSLFPKTWGGLQVREWISKINAVET